MKTFFDSSAFAKRYVEEDGSGASIADGVGGGDEGKGLGDNLVVPFYSSEQESDM